MMKFSEMQKDVLFLQKSLVDMHKSLLNEENNNKLFVFLFYFYKNLNWVCTKNKKIVGF